ncbi:hypothetical protein [Hydrogenimonas sp.]
MSKVTISDFIIAVADLFEAESRALRESTAIFMQHQREAFEKSVYSSGWRLAWIFASIVTLLCALAFIGIGLYKIASVYLPDWAALFSIGALLIVASLVFARLAARSLKKEEQDNE